MRANRRYLVAMALLAVLAVGFGLLGTVAPPLAESELVAPQQAPESSSSSSDSVGHFQNPPSYDSGWVDIRGKAGQYVTLRHGLNTTEVVVDITGKQSLNPNGGALAWTKTCGGIGSEQASSVVQTSDGGYALAGRTNSYGAGSDDFWLVKIDYSGNVQWNRTYGGTNIDYANSVVQTADGGFVLAGMTWSFGVAGDVWLVKTDSGGNTLWNQTYGGANNDYARSVVQTGDGGYAVAGYTNSYGAGSSDFWMVKIRAEMNLEHQRNLGSIHYVPGWSKTYGGTGSDVAYSVIQTSDGGYALAGYTDSFGAGGTDFWMVRETDGEMGFTMTDLTSNSITLYRGKTDPDWNYVRVRMWLIKEPTWIYGDINMDGVVDVKDLYILSRNYGKTFSLLSLSGIIAIAGIHTYKTKRKQPKQPSYIS